MNATIPQTTGKDKQRTENSRLREQSLHEQFDRPTPFLATEPVLQNQNIIYQVAEKSQATIQGGLPAIHSTFAKSRKTLTLALEEALR
ncbi:MAG: hypothetical protein ACFCD0_17550 [Gemmataceae bacterium]